MSWIQTYTGKKFDLADPQPDMVCIEDISHALSHLCRYTGHSRAFYSVAQHSILVASHLPREIALQGLLHDATEAYVGDVSWPLKQLLPEYKVIEQRVWRVIADKFGLPEELDPRVKEMDGILLMAEKRELLGEAPEPWAPQFEALVEKAKSIQFQPKSIGACRQLFMWSYNILQIKE